MTLKPFHILFADDLVAFNRVRRKLGVSTRVYRRILRARAQRHAREARRNWLEPESKAVRRWRSGCLRELRRIENVLLRQYPNELTIVKRKPQWGRFTLRMRLGEHVGDFEIQWWMSETTAMARAGEVYHRLQISRLQRWKDEAVASVAGWPVQGSCGLPVLCQSGQIGTFVVDEPSGDCLE